MNSPVVFALICPVCGGQVEKMGERGSRSLYVCKECDCDLNVPVSAWNIARNKREQKWPIKRSTIEPLRPLFGAGVSVASGPGTRQK